MVKIFNNSELLEKIGERIKEERKRLNYSLETLAEKVHISRQTLARWEKGKGAGPFVRDLLRMCKVFHCDFGYLVGEYDCRTRVATDICKETGLSHKAVSFIIDYKDHFGYIGLLSALLESPRFLEAMHYIYEALSCKQSDARRVREASQSESLRAVTSRESVENMIGQEILQTYSRFSDYSTLVPRFIMSESFLQTAQEKFKGAALEAIEKVENNHSMDEILLQESEEEILHFIREPKYTDFV